MKFFASMACLATLATFVTVKDSVAQESQTPVFSQFGGVGALKTRTARVAADSTLSSSVSWNREQQRYALTFQAAPWLETTFSYSGFDPTPTNSTFDRQFDIKARLWEETLYLPEVAIGLQDFLGTGLFSGEYIVASKRFGPLDLSLGAGWGRLASQDVISNPLGGVRDDDFGVGGDVNFGNWFRGDDIGVFGSIIYDTPIKNLRLIAEYDSDDNDPVNGLDDNPWNFGVIYNPTPGIQLGASVLAQDEVNLHAAFSTETGRWVKDKPTGADTVPFFTRSQSADEGGGSDGLIAPIQPSVFSPVSRDALPEKLREELGKIGIGLSKIQMNSDTVRLVITNGKYRSFAKAVGRAARILSLYAPGEVETFQIAIDQKRLETAEFKLSRTQLEESAREIGYSVAPPPLSFAMITPGSEPVRDDEIDFREFPNFDWSVGPNLRLNTFDPDDPLRAQLDIEAKASVEPLPGLFLSGIVATDVIGNFDNITRESDSVLPRVRSEFNLYNQETDVGVYRLAAEYFFDAAPNVHAKLSGGLLEQMFAGVGGEVLWRPRNSRLAFGAEAFWAKQRDFDTLFTFQDFNVVTGHLSAYLDTTYNNWNVAVHAGRYLARDWGATLELNRRFPNGWEIGAFATLTDVPFVEFGEGSFDKGLTLKIPLDWGLPFDSQFAGEVTLRPVQRDGGQRLRPGNRLFRLTQPTSQGEVASQWSSFAH